jgi:hypothetical protein
VQEQKKRLMPCSKRQMILSWNNQWIVAQPLYSRAEAIFLQRGMKSKALYAEVSQIPSRVESASLPATILQLTQDLARPEAQDPETRLRILTIPAARAVVQVGSARKADPH